MGNNLYTSDTFIYISFFCINNFPLFHAFFFVLDEIKFVNIENLFPITLVFLKRLKPSCWL